MSRILVSARIRQNLKGETGEKFKISQNDPTNSSQETFDNVFESSKKYEEIYGHCFSHLLQPFFNGTNVSVLLFGESNSGQLKTVFGGEIGNIIRSKKSSSLITLLVNDLFQVPIDGRGSRSIEKSVLKMSILKIKGSSITDLMEHCGNTSRADSPCLVENELDGVQLKNIIELEVIGTKDCLSMMESSIRGLGIWDEESTTDTKDSTILIQFEMLSNNQNMPLNSWFRIFCLPGAEKLMNKLPDSSARPQSASLDVHTLGNIIMHLSECSTNYQVPNYRESILTSLMGDVLGGNCLTSCLVTFKPVKTPASAIIMRYALRMKNIVNFPVQNTFNFKNVLRRYRWVLRRMQSNLGDGRKKEKAYIDELKKAVATFESKIRQMETEQEEYKTQIEDAENRLANANRKYAELTSSRTEISSRMVSSEQEKLKLSKEIVDLQLVNNTIKQEAEKQIFELKQKNLSLEERVSDMERNLALEKRGHEDQKERVAYLKQEHQDLSEEYINLKGNYATLSEEHQNLVNKNERLVEEIANLADTKEQIIKHKDYMEMQQLQDFTSQLKAIAKNLSQDSKSRKSSSSSRLQSSNNKRLDLEKQLLQNVQEREDRLDSVREEHKIELKRLEDKLKSLREDLKETTEQAELYKRTMAEQNAELILINEQKIKSEEMCEKLDEKWKETSRQYCTRLETYITDLKGYIWNQQGELLDKNTKEKVEHLDRMLDGLKKGYNADKEMLQNKVTRTTAYVHEILQRHEQLLTAYKLILWKTGVGGTSRENIERDFEMTLPPIEEIKDEQIKEKNDLKTKLYLSQQNVKELQEKVDKLKDRLKEETSQSERRTEGDEQKGAGFSLRALRRDMHDFTVNVQVELEKERAELITRCTLAEQQVAEYEEYIDTYVRRYQHEIVNLRKMLTESGRLQSADGVLALEPRPTKMLPPLQNDRPYRLQQRNSRY